MDFDKYFIQKGGLYSVHFINKDGLSEYQIRDIFCKYGHIVSLSRTNQIHGFWFIKYKTLEETIACLKGLQNHPSIRILKEKSKIETISTNSKDKNFNEVKDSFQKNFCQQNSKYQDTSRLNRNLERDLPTFDGKSNNWSREDTNNYQNGERNKKTISNKDNCTETSSPHLSMNIKSNNISECPLTDTNTKTVPSMKQLLKLQKLRGINAKTFSTLNETETVGRSKEILNDNEFSALACEESLGRFSPLSHSSNISNNCDSKTMDSNVKSEHKIVPASEIIVTNIPAKYGLHYILHLFESFNPIAGTVIKTIPKTNIRYCLVYFEKKEDTIEIEKKFNNYLLENQHLIVLQPQNLERILSNEF